MSKKKKKEVKLLTLEEVALTIGVSIYTINVWYKFKRTNPENEIAQMLPDYVQNGGRQKRYWKESEIYKFLQFKENLPHGRNGIMGEVTQKYVS